jgi:hypothetical protein
VLSVGGARSASVARGASLAGLEGVPGGVGAWGAAVAGAAFLSCFAAKSAGNREQHACKDQWGGRDLLRGNELGAQQQQGLPSSPVLLPSLRNMYRH